MKKILYYDYLGEVAFDEAYRLQKNLWRGLLDPDCDHGWLLLLSHPPTYTVGKRGAADNFLCDPELLKKRGYELVETDRGGMVTYHGPGQLVGYPILPLKCFGINGIRKYVATLERLIIELCRSAGVEGTTDPERPGVWVGKDKIGAIGIRASRGVTTHGFAVNIAPNLGDYRWIRACGLVDRGITSLEALGHLMDMEQAAIRAASIASNIWNVKLERADSRKFKGIVNEVSL